MSCVYVELAVGRIWYMSCVYVELAVGRIWYMSCIYVDWLLAGSCQQPVNINA